MDADGRKLLIGIAAVYSLFAALAFDLHFYLFDRTQYLLRQSAKKCVEAEMTLSGYYECKRDKHNRDARGNRLCEYVRAAYVEKQGKCEAARAALDADTIRDLADKEYREYKNE